MYTVDLSLARWVSAACEGCLQPRGAGFPAARPLWLQGTGARCSALVVVACRLSGCGTRHHSMWESSRTRVNPYPPALQVVSIHCTTSNVPRSFTLLEYLIHNHISPTLLPQCLTTPNLIWHSHLLHKINTIIFPISQMKKMSPASLTCPQSFININL